MVRIASNERLLRISEAKKSTLVAWAEGTHVESSTGRSLAELCDRATGDRLALAKQFLKDGEAMLRANPPLYRSAISRLYYSMYHAMRAVVYYQHGGDDHEKHSDLPGHTPSDFPNAPIWQNALKDARERRNSADYEPYPKSPRAWSIIATTIAGDANALFSASRAYLRNKGSQFV